MSDDELSEVYLVVRAEEQRAVERALDGVLPPVHSTFHAVGRGRGGGLRVARPATWWPFGRAPAGEFLPKVVTYIVVPSTVADEVLRAVTEALRAERGDAEHGLGVAFVLPVEQEIAIRRDRPLAAAGEAAS